MKSKLEYNEEILKTLEYYVKKYPNMNFCQLLYMLNFYDGKNKFNEESSSTLINMTYNSINNFLDYENNKGFTK